MEIIEETQGTPEWALRRTKRCCASEAPIVMGVSKHMTRDQLLAMKKFGIEKTVSDYVKNVLFDKGHEVEELAMPFVELTLGETLYPVTGVATIEGLPLLASFDGLTVDEKTGWENKLANLENRDAIAKFQVPEENRWQLEHQLLVSGAEKVYFTASDGTQEGTYGVFYVSDKHRRRALIAAWKQFQEDLEAYEHEPEVVRPAAAAIMELPALSIRIMGAVQETNLPLFEAKAMELIGRIKTDLQTDQDFVDAENIIKFCGSAEKQIEVVKSAAIAQTADIDLLFRTVDKVSAELRSKRLMLEKLVKTQKDTVRAQAVRAATMQLQGHIDALNKSLGSRYITDTVADFPGVIKGKKTLTSIKGAMNNEIARAKIAANEQAEAIRTNLKTLEDAGDYRFLFSDLATVVLKHPEDFALLVISRVEAHKKAEEEKMEAERTRIRAEEEAKANAAAQAKIDAAAKQAQEQPRQATQAARPVNQSQGQMDIGIHPDETVTVNVDRPSNEAIIDTLATVYCVKPITIIEWLGEMDLVEMEDHFLLETA